MAKRQSVTKDSSKSTGKGLAKGLGSRALGASPLAGSPLSGGGLGGGQGIGALIPGGSAIGRLLEVSLDHVRPDPQQPRKRFQQEALQELADSIKANGILQPLIVSPSGGGFYQIIAGERRWRAAKLAGLVKVPVVSREVGEQEAFELALLENIQRVDLTPLEESLSYKRLAEEFNLSHEQIAERTGKKRATITNALRLLKLPNDVLSMIDSEQLSAGHGRTLLGLKEEHLMSSFAQQSIAGEWSVRELERQIKNYLTADDDNQENTVRTAAWVGGFEQSISKVLAQHGLQVKVKAQRSGAAQLQVLVNDESMATKLLTLLQS